MKRWLACILASVTGAACASDWPQWRGLLRDGISPERVQSAWPADGPKKLWQAKVGAGFSSISVAQGRAYTMGNTNATDAIWCLDARSGKVIWRHSYPARLDPQYYEGGPGATPTVDRGQVFTISKWGDVFCLDAATGQILWKKELRSEGICPNRWGFAGSPLVLDNLIFLNAGSRGTALDRKTGNIVWHSGTNTTGYASPMLFKRGDDKSILIFGAKHLFGVDPETGTQQWSHAWETVYDLNAADPLVIGQRIFISSHSRGCALLSLESGQPELIYDRKTLHNHLSAGVAVGDYLYAFDGEASRNTSFRCIDLTTGELKWASKDPSFGSVIGAAGVLIVLSARGDLLLVRSSPDEFGEIARAHVMNGRCWTSPALANGCLYVRNAAGDLICLDLGPES